MLFVLKRLEIDDMPNYFPVIIDETFNWACKCVYHLWCSPCISCIGDLGFDCLKEVQRTQRMRSREHSGTEICHILQIHEQLFYEAHWRYVSADSLLSLLFTLFHFSLFTSFLFFTYSFSLFTLFTFYFFSLFSFLSYHLLWHFITFNLFFSPLSLYFYLTLSYSSLYLTSISINFLYLLSSLIYHFKPLKLLLNLY